jgi:hypothetical protein
MTTETGHTPLLHEKQRSARSIQFRGMEGARGAGGRGVSVGVLSPDPLDIRTTADIAYDILTKLIQR